MVTIVKKALSTYYRDEPSELLLNQEPGGPWRNDRLEFLSLKPSSG